MTLDPDMPEEQGNGTPPAQADEDAEAPAVPPIAAPVHKDAMPTEGPDDGAQL